MVKCIFGRILTLFLILIAVKMELSYGAPQPSFRNKNLIAFPRIGRHVNRDFDDFDKTSEDYAIDNKIRKISNANMKSGLWFGPRLGRIQKRKSYIDDTLGYLLLRDLSSYRHTPKYTPRLGRDSEEIFEELNDNHQTSY